jgi:hypothetical protein
MVNIEDIREFLEAVNFRIEHTEELEFINCGGCGWYAYYTQREILKRWPGVTVEYVYLNREGSYGSGLPYAEFIRTNAEEQDDTNPYTCSASHVISKVTTPQGDSLWWDSDYVSDDEDIFFDDDCGNTFIIDDIFDMKPSTYRKGALEVGKNFWNWMYNPRRNNKALRACLN